jgi:polyhydroxybutyrate depolymerase
MRTNCLSRRPSLLAAVAVAVCAQSSQAQDGRPTLRERIKEWRQKQSATPPQGPAKITAAGDYTYELSHGGLQRKYIVHVPPKYNAASAAPMVLALHGGGGFAEYQANEENYGLISKSNQAGFVAVFPNGYSPFRGGKFATWNAGTCCAGARDRNIDDVGFLRAVVADVSQRLNIDRAKVYSIGMSNGALMSYRLACEAPDMIKGIMAVAGTDNTTQCTPKSAVSILHIHAKNDDHVNVGGGAGAATRDLSKVTNFTSVNHTIDKWVRLNQCNPKPKRVLEVDGASCDLYSGCSGDSQVKLCLTERGGHSWPGGTKTRASEPTSKAIIANDVMWDFFARR